MSKAWTLLLAGACVLGASRLAVAADSAPASDGKAAAGTAAKYTLRYRFLPGETIRWAVAQQGNVTTSVAGTTQTADMTTKSVKMWRIKKVEPNDGPITLENYVEDVDMVQQFSGRAPVKYNSRTDKTPPPMFAAVAKSVGVPLARITIDRTGRVLNREQLATENPERNGQVTLPLPEGPIAVGENWTLPADLEVPRPNGTVKKIKTQQKFTLEDVRHGVAKIRTATQILSPIDDPAVQAQIMQTETTGMLRFDIEAGRILGQETDLDKRVVGFRGESSMCHYRSRVTEELVARSGEAAGAPEKKVAAGEKPATDVPAPEKNASEKVAAEKSVEKPASEKASPEKAVEKTASEKKPVEKSAARVKAVVPDPTSQK